MNQAPDYSAAYVILETDRDLRGHGMTFTIGRGTEVVATAVRALAPLVIGWRLSDVVHDPREFWRRLTGDSHLRWIGPEKGVMHLATAALVNAVWDLWARSVGKPLWKLVVDMSPAEIVGCIDFRYISDALTPRTGDRAAGGESRRPGRSRGGAPPGWISRLHHLDRMAGIHR